MSFPDYFPEFSSALSPLREAAAYEALWDDSNASVKRIAEKVTLNHQAPLSQMIATEVVERYVQQLQQQMKSLLGQFEVCFLGQADYPKKLLDAKHPIPLLYYQGAWDLVFSPSVAVVGTRNPTPEGIKRTQKLVKSLSCK